MQRRLLLTTLGAMMAGAPALAQSPLAQSPLAQSPPGQSPPGARKRRVGMLIYLPNQTFERGFLQAMREVGYVEGENLEVVRRTGDGSDERLERAAAELAAERVELIVVWSTNAAEAARRATTTIPILISVADPLGSGLIRSLGRPEANLTGVSSIAFEIAEKRVSLLIEALPGVKSLAFLGLRGESNMQRFLDRSRLAAGRAAIDMGLAEVADMNSIEPAIAAAAGAGVQGLVLQQIFYPKNAEVAALLLKHRMPAISWQRSFTDAGGLVAYGAVPEDNYQRLSRQAHKLLSGAAPANVPVEQATRTEVTVNLRTARQMGLTLSPPFLGRADDVIE